MPDYAGVVFAAGLGTRLRPLTNLLPKALCPVNNKPLVDYAIERARMFTEDVAVNVHHHRDVMVAHLSGTDVHVSVEEPEPLGTAGALGKLRSWIDGRAVVATNSDAWFDCAVSSFLDSWDGETVRLFVVADATNPDFDGRWRFAGISAMPWSRVEHLDEMPAGLFEAVWRPAIDEGRVEYAECTGRFFDCGTPRDYLAANLTASSGESVIGASATVLGSVVRTVVWPASYVGPDETLVDAIRAGREITLHPFAE